MSAMFLVSMFILLLGGITILLRYGPLLFLRSTNEIKISKRGFLISAAEHKQKVESIGEAFVNGFNTMLRQRKLEEVKTQGEKLPPFLRPFFFEGVAAGYLPKNFFSFRWKSSKFKDFEDLIELLDKKYLYLYYVGLGFWCGFRYKNNPGKVEKLVDPLHPVYRYLCYDGFGFKLGFFDYGDDQRIINKCLKFDGYARHACYQGVGRSLWFVFMDSPERIFAQFNQIDESYRGDCYAGLGLAVAFTNIDNLAYIFDFARRVDIKYCDHFYLGVTFALAARRMNDGAYFTQRLEELDHNDRESCFRVLEICDECFKTSSSYEGWRNCTCQRIIKEVLSNVLA